MTASINSSHNNLERTSKITSVFPNAALPCYGKTGLRLKRQAPDMMAGMEIDMDTVEINGRSDFALWAIQRAQEIVMAEGAALALAACDMNEEALQENGAALGKAIADAMLEVFDGLMTE